MTLLALLGGLVAAGSAALLWWQDGHTHALAQAQAEGQQALQQLGASQQTCDAMKTRALAWTVTRRAAQSQQYQKAKTDCLRSAEASAALIPQAAALRDGLLAYATLMEEIASGMTEDGRNAATARFMGEAEPLSKRIDEHFAALQTDQTQRSELALADLSQGSRRALYAMAAACLIALVLSGAILQFLVRFVVRPVVDVAACARGLAQGDLTQSCTSLRTDEVGELYSSLESVRLSWVEALTRVRSTARSVGDAATLIVRDSSTLAERAARQASSLKNVSASMLQITRTTSANAAGAQEATALAEAAREVAQQGGKHVVEVVGTMDAIQQSSRRIADITSFIDDIAHQTNLLSLNAAVEAARAGEQGRGFSVVAGEVRQLAAKALHSARDIRGVVDASASRVEQGAEKVSSARGTMEQILRQVADVSQLIQSIAHSSTEQHRDIATVTGSVDEADRLTQSNLAMVDQWSHAATSLQEQVQVLERVLDQFKLPEMA